MMDVDELIPMRVEVSDGERESDGGDERQDEGGREVPEEEDDMDMQLQDRRTKGGSMMGVSQKQSMFSYKHWLQTQLFAPTTRAQPPAPIVSMDEDNGEDFRDHEEEDFEREGGDCDTDLHSPRIKEPLKRYPGHTRNDSDHAMPTVQPSKRRRITVGETFFGGIPALSERQQAIAEYISPSCLSPLFFFMGFTRFALAYVICMYVLHSLQTYLTNFGPSTKSLRCKTAWWNIPPLPHSMMDTYLWNHSMVTMMVSFPTWFCTENQGNAAYWMGVFFVFQQQIYWQVSLKTHYVKNHQAKVPDHWKSKMESYYMQCLLIYILSASLFALAKIYDSSILFHVGLTQFNLAPIYMLWDYTRRVKKFTGTAVTIFDGGSEAVTGASSKKEN